jgi:hypothetical protein
VNAPMSEDAMTDDPANPTNALWSTGTDEAGVAIGYMCLIDWQHHVGADAFGWKVYPSKEELVAVHPTAETSCGIIEIEMRARRIVVEQDLRGEEVARTCAACMWWAQDDDGDGLGACAVLLNDPEARGWRTLPDYGCERWEAASCAAPDGEVK